jgi:hypothetical protein
MPLHGSQSFSQVSLPHAFVCCRFLLSRCMERGFSWGTFWDWRKVKLVLLTQYLPVKMRPITMFLSVLIITLKCITVRINDSHFSMKLPINEATSFIFKSRKHISLTVSERPLYNHIIFEGPLYCYTLSFNGHFP